jgi:hypothetical protein
MHSFTQRALEIIERRFNEFSIDVKSLTVESLMEKFGRQQVSTPAFYFELQLIDIRCALTVTVLDEQQADDYESVRAVSEEVGRLLVSGRFVVYHQVIVAPQGTILLDLVGPERSSNQILSEESAEKFLQRLLDHDAVRPLLN